MTFGPRQNYQLYANAISARRLELDRATTVPGRFRRYSEYFDLINDVTESRDDLPGIRHDGHTERLATRKKMVLMFHRLDEWLHEGCAQDYAD